MNIVVVALAIAAGATLGLGRASARRLISCTALLVIAALLTVFQTPDDQFNRTAFVGSICYFVTLAISAIYHVSRPKPKNG